MLSELGYVELSFREQDYINKRKNYANYKRPNKMVSYNSEGSSDEALI